MNGDFSAPGQSSGLTTILASSFFEPFATSGNPIGGTGAGKSNIGLATGYTTSQSPLGYQEMSSQYQYYKVHWAELEVTINSMAVAGTATVPTSPADQLWCYLCPSTAPFSTSSLATAGAQPYAKRGMTVAGARPLKLKCRIDLAKLLGYNKTQYLGIAPALFGAGPGVTLQSFFNFWWQAAGAPVGSAYFEFVLTQMVEVSEIETFST